MKRLLLASLMICGLIILTPYSVSAIATGEEGGGNSLVENVKCEGNSKTCVPDGTDPAVGGCGNKEDCNIVARYINPFIKIFSILAGVAIVIGIIVGGIQYSASGGDPQKVASAKKHIRNAIIALLGFLFLYGFLRFLIPGNWFTG